MIRKSVVLTDGLRVPPTFLVGTWKFYRALLSMNLSVILRTTKQCTPRVQRVIFVASLGLRRVRLK